MTKLNKILIIFLTLFFLLIIVAIPQSEDYKSTNHINSEDPFIERLKSSDITINEWNFTWGETYMETAYSMAIDSQGDIFLAGYKHIGSDFLLVKVSKSGQYLWHRTWSRGNLYARCDSIYIDPDDNIYLSGVANAPTFGTDAVLLKYDNAGNLLWERIWEGTYRNERYYDIDMDSSGDIYITGRTEVSNDDYQVLLQKYDDAGNLIWSETWGNAGENDMGFGLTIDSNDYAYVCGVKDREGGNVANNLLLKYNSDGANIWNKTYQGISNRYDSFEDIELDNQEDICLSGFSGTITGDTNPIIMKCNKDGVQLWNRTVLSHSGTYAVETDKKGNIFFTSDKDGGGVDITLFKYSTNGTQLWNKTFDDNYNIICYDIDIDNEENIYLGGHRSIHNNDVYLIKYHSPLVIEVFEPTENQVYSYDSPFFNISINNSELNSTWYRVNFGVKRTLTQFDGKINQTDWDLCINGSNRINFYANDTWGYTFGKSVIIQKDIEAPEINITNPTPNFVFGNNTFNYNLSINEANLDSIWYSLNNGVNLTNNGLFGLIAQSAWDLCENGTVTLTFYANDTMGNVGSDEIKIRKDQYLPNLIISSPSKNDEFGLEPPDYHTSITGTYLSKKWYTLNDSQKIFFEDDNGSIDQDLWDSFGNGSLILKFFANNTGGNIVFSEILITKYLELYISKPLDNRIFNHNPPHFNLSLIDWNSYTLFYTLNGGTNYSISELNGEINRTAWNQCEDGLVNITFYAKYLDTFLLHKNIVVFKDTTDPNLTILSPQPYQTFGNSSLNIFYDISVSDPNLNTTWYSLNDGQNYTISNYFGRIDQFAWNSCLNETVSLKFYANDFVNNMVVREITIIKDYNILLPRNAYAIIVGVEDYPGTTDDLTYCRDDAESVNQFLIDYCNFKPDNIILLLDSNATNRAINNAFTKINKYITEEDIFFFYYSGHGAYDSSLGYTIFPYDSINPFNPSMCYWDYVLDYRLDTLDSENKIIIIDACNSGGMIGESIGNRCYMMTSCHESELSFEDHSIEQGIFTYYFLRSLDYGTDQNDDGVISLEEQYPYIRYRVYQHSDRDSSPQEYDNIVGETVLYPSIGDLTISLSGNQLDYNFYLYGHGSLNQLEISACSAYGSLPIITKNLKFESPSLTGFGLYSDSIQTQGENITGYEIKIKIDGFNTFNYYEIFGDTDSDVLTDFFEITNGTGLNPNANDTDFDGLDDFVEFYGVTNPLLNDTDSDGLLDGFEVLTSLTNPLLNDTDGDGISDGIEVLTYSTDPLLRDTDSDNLSDYEEIFIYFTDPLLQDTDSDQIPDEWEILNLLNPLIDDADLDPDFDALSNLFEFQNNCNPYNNDTDLDGLTDGLEVLTYLTDPLSQDTDSDGLSDSDEIHVHNTDPRNRDSDSDRLNDGQEINLNTDPNNPDTDGDGYSDGEEVIDYNSDPLDPNDPPRENPPPAIPGFNMFLFIGIIVVISTPLIPKRVKS